MDILKFALDMELDGMEYYMEQADENKGNALHKVCLMLAEDEKNHAKILTDKMNGVDSVLIDTDTLSKAKAIFQNSDDIESPIKETPSQLDFYRIAKDKEKQSIEIYTDLLSKAVEDMDKDLFNFLIKQEVQHYKVLDELANLLRHAEEWVEFAEFGLRKDY